MFENSRVTCPSQPGSKGVTFTIIPHLAYVDFPKHITKTSFGILKYSTVLAKAKELGGIIHSLPIFVTKLSFYDTFWLAIYFGIILTALFGRFLKVEKSTKDRLNSGLICQRCFQLEQVYFVAKSVDQLPWI